MVNKSMGNDRLSDALNAAAKIAKRNKKRHYAFEDRRFASAASRANWEKIGPRVATSTIRVHKDVIPLAQSAWPKSAERIAETSEIIRKAAKKRLGL